MLLRTFVLICVLLVPVATFADEKSDRLRGVVIELLLNELEREGLIPVRSSRPVVLLHPKNLAGQIQAHGHNRAVVSVCGRGIAVCRDMIKRLRELTSDCDEEVLIGYINTNRYRLDRIPPHILSPGRNIRAFVGITNKGVRRSFVERGVITQGKIEDALHCS